MDVETVQVDGCAPEPIIYYLKALGVLRLVASQKDPGARSSWSNNTFTVHTTLDTEGLLGFFLEEYAPTPLLAPWNGGSGFWSGKTATSALAAMKSSTNPRLEACRRAISCAEEVLRDLGLERKPTNKEKVPLIRRLRSTLPDEAVAWIDAACALTEDQPSYAPLLGTGGNDGNLEFSNKFMQRLAEVIPFSEKGWPERGGRRDPARQSREWLEASLFAKKNPELIKAAIGQFHPGGVGGPNAAQGFGGCFVVNPWDYVLMLEGALLLAGSVARRSGLGSRQKAAFPFTVWPSPGGSQTVTFTEAMRARQEVWMPLWERPASLPEIVHLLAEGRAQVGRRPAANGGDFARAIASLGVDRGIAGFSRFAFVQRSGKAHIAAPLGYFPVRFQPAVGLLEEVDPWLLRYRRLARDGPGSFQRALKGIDNAIFSCCRDGRPASFQRVLVALADAERATALSQNARERLGPLQNLSLRWLGACDDSSVEYRLARSVASICASPGDRNARTRVGPVRTYIEPLRRNTAGRYEWHPGSTSFVWARRALTRNLLAVLERRCVDAQRLGVRDVAPLAAHRTCNLEDIHLFLSGAVDDARIEALIGGLVLLQWPLQGMEAPEGVEQRNGYTPPGINPLYALSKILFHPWPGHTAGEGNRPSLRPEMPLLCRLRSGDVNSVVRIAHRRIRAAGRILLGTSGSRHRDRLPDPILPPHLVPRIAAALLFPISNASASRLMHLMLREPRAEEGSAADLTETQEEVGIK